MTLATEVNKTNIQHCLLIDLELNSTTTYYLSNHYQSVSYNGNDYTQLGYFLQMSEMQNDIKPTNNQIQIALAGVPETVVPNFPSMALNANIKGSRVKIYRAFFEDNTLIDAYLRFSGYVSNYTLNETWDDIERLTSYTLSLQCSNLLAVIERQYAGRRTNEKDQKVYFPGDTGFDRVKILSDSSFDFGKKN
jgi:hypothetical protein